MVTLLPPFIVFPFKSRAEDGGRHVLLSWCLSAVWIVLRVSDPGPASYSFIQGKIFHKNILQAAIFMTGSNAEASFVPNSSLIDKSSPQQLDKTDGQLLFRGNGEAQIMSGVCMRLLYNTNPGIRPHPEQLHVFIRTNWRPGINVKPSDLHLNELRGTWSTNPTN